MGIQMGNVCVWGGGLLHTLRVDVDVDVFVC